MNHMLPIEVCCKISIPYLQALYVSNFASFTNNTRTHFPWFFCDTACGTTDFDLERSVRLIPTPERERESSRSHVSPTRLSNSERASAPPFAVSLSLSIGAHFWPFPPILGLQPMVILSFLSATWGPVSCSFPKICDTFNNPNMRDKISLRAAQFWRRKIKDLLSELDIENWRSLWQRRMPQFGRPMRCSFRFSYP